MPLNPIPAQLRRSVIANLDHYLVEAERRVTDQGGQVLYAADTPAVATLIGQLAQDRGITVDSAALRAALDAGTSDYFEPSDRPRQHSLAPGCQLVLPDFVITDAGALCLMGPVGPLAPLLIAVASIERLLPRSRDLSTLLPLLSSTGFTLLAGSRREGEFEGGPEEFFLIFYDAGRSQLLANPELRDLLLCIHCGECLRVCPVVARSDHNPLLPILSPGAVGQPEASTLCGACRQACPVDIDIPRALLALRSQSATPPSQLQSWLANLWSYAVVRPRLYEFMGVVLGSFGPLARLGWFPQPTAQPFRKQWRERKR